MFQLSDSGRRLANFIGDVDFGNSCMSFGTTLTQKSVISRLTWSEIEIEWNVGNFVLVFECENA